MLRTIGNTFGGVMAMLCLTSTLALAQSQSPSWHYTTPPQLQKQAQTQSREMTCLADDGKGNCTAAAEVNGTPVAVVGEGAHRGDRMRCQDLGSVIDCQPIARMALTASNMTCTTDDGHGNCTAGVGTDGHVIAVIGEDIQIGDHMTCAITDNVMHCTQTW